MLKKFFAALLLSSSTLAVSAANPALDDLSGVYVGGNVALWYSWSGGQTNVSILPEVGYNINDRWAAGTQIGFQYLKNDEVSSTAFVFAPYARLNCFRTGIVSLFVDGGVDLALGRCEGTTLAFFGVGFKPGIAITPVPKLSLVAHLGFLGYQGANSVAQDAGYRSGVGFDFRNSLSFGAYYNF